MVHKGPAFGYHANYSISWPAIVERILAHVHITCMGKRHLCAGLGIQSFAHEVTMGCRSGQNYAWTLLFNLAVRLSTLVSGTLQLVSWTVQLIKWDRKWHDILPIPFKGVHTRRALIYSHVQEEICCYCALC